MSDKVIIFDTTLRDGEQCPGASMNLREKMEIARQLARLNVDVIEAGFPVISAGDFEAVQTIAEEIKGPIICGLARCVTKDIDAAGAALRPAGERARIHVFLATSAIHREFKLKKAEEEIMRLAIEGVKQRQDAGAGCGVLARGCVPHRAGVPGQGRAGGHRFRSHHGKYSGYRRLRCPGTVRRPDQLSPRQT